MGGTLPSNKLVVMTFAFSMAVFILQVMFLVNNECRVSSSRYIRETHGGISRVLIKSDIEDVQVAQQVHPTTNSSLPERLEFPKSGRKRRLTIGIPTVKREGGSYLPGMLRSMFNKTSDDQLKHIVFVVLLADIENVKWKTEMEATIRSNYSKHIESGSLIVTQVPSSFYANFNVSFDDKYLYWRTKQNFDYAYLMKYSEHLSTYYMQMEDDVIASDGYYVTIDNFIRKQTDDNWICLEFSELGFIGKLYHSKHITALADMLLIFNLKQPVDFTYIYFNLLMAQYAKLMHKPTLFQHMGYHSSLAKKIQPLQDRYSYWPEKQFHGDNPPAEVQTSMDTYADFPSYAAYNKEPGYFWTTRGVKEGDTFTVIFDSPQAVDKIIVDTGCKVHPEDRLYSGIVSISPNLTLPDNQSPCSNFIQVGTFNNGVANITDVASKMGVFMSKCVEITVTHDQIQWLIIREIAIILKRD